MVAAKKVKKSRKKIYTLGDFLDGKAQEGILLKINPKWGGKASDSNGRELVFTTETEEEIKLIVDKCAYINRSSSKQHTRTSESFMYLGTIKGSTLVAVKFLVGGRIEFFCVPERYKNIRYFMKVDES